MEYLFLLYTPSTKLNLGWMLTRQNKFQWQRNFLFFQKKFNYNIFNDVTGKIDIPEFLDSGRKSWTLDSGHRILDSER